MSIEKYAFNNSEKPFWLRSPWIILFDLVRLQRVRPWNVDLSYLLTTLVHELKRGGYIDLTASGIALFSSATIYRMKSELVLELQEPPKPPPERPMEVLPPPIQLPYRHEYTLTTIENLIKALERVLKRLFNEILKGVGAFPKRFIIGLPVGGVNDGRKIASSHDDDVHDHSTNFSRVRSEGEYSHEPVMNHRGPCEHVHLFCFIAVGPFEESLHRV